MSRSFELNSYDEKICRLCAESRSNCHELFKGGSESLDQLVNSICGYLGIEFMDDGLLPNWICSSCQLEATITEQFMNLIRTGQRKLRDRSIEILHPPQNKPTDPIETDTIFTSPENVPQAPSIKEIQPKRVMRKTSGFIIRRTSSSPTEEVTPSQEVTTSSQSHKGTSSPGQEVTTRPSQRLRRKPKRLLDEIQGRKVPQKTSQPTIVTPTKEIDSGVLITSQPIAELRSPTGTSLGELIEVEPEDKEKSSSKAYFVCEFCKEAFGQQKLFRKHIGTHKNCAYECTECLESFQSKCRFEQHQEQTQHTGMGIIENVDESQKLVKESSGNDKSDDASSAPINIVVGSNGQITSIDTKMLDEKKRKNNKNDNDSQDEATDYDDDDYDDSASMPGSPDNSNKDIAEKLSDSKYACLRCQKTYNTDYAVRRHYKLVHVGLRKYKCDICPASFKTKYNCDVHKAAHKGEKRHKCDYCTKSFITNHECKVHMRTHTGEKPYKCTFCSKAFGALTNLVVHKRTHTGERPHKCSACSASFSNATHLKKHKEVHLRAAQQKLLQEAEDEQPQSLLKTRSLLKKSIETSKNKQNIPKGPKILGVDILPPIKNVAKSTIHELIKKAKAPKVNYKFQCATCQKMFKHKSALTKHERTHTGERPYKCPVCPKRFADPSNLNKHKTLHKNATASLNAVHESNTSTMQELQQMMEEQSLNIARSPVSDPDPDGQEALQRMDKRTFTLSPSGSEFDNDDDDNEDFVANQYPMQPVVLDNAINWNNVDAIPLQPLQPDNVPLVTTSLIPFNGTTAIQGTQVANVTNQLVCISYQDPFNPIDKKTTTFYVVN